MVYNFGMMDTETASALSVIDGRLASIETRLFALDQTVNRLSFFIDDRERTRGDARNVLLKSCGVLNVLSGPNEQEALRIDAPLDMRIDMLAATIITLQKIINAIIVELAQ